MAEAVAPVALTLVIQAQQTLVLHLIPPIEDGNIILDFTAPAGVQVDNMILVFLVQQVVLALHQ